MIEIFNYLDQHDCTAKEAAKEKVKQKYNLMDWQADIIYSVWKERYMVAKVKVDYGTKGRRFFYEQRSNRNICRNSG